MKPDDSPAEADTSLAWLEYLAGNAPAAEMQFQRALYLDPGYANAHYWYAMFLNDAGRSPQAEVEFSRAQEAAPLSVPIRCNAAMYCFRVRRYNEALDLLKRTIELDGSSPFVHGSLGAVYSCLGNHRESAAEFQKAAQLSGVISN